MDRISKLPDDLLGHVLSFLTTKEAALVSVLSKRWRNMLAFVPNLDIDDTVFLHPQESKWERDRVLQSFKEFVDRVLTLQGDSRIEKFSLKCEYIVDSERMNQWICRAVQRGVLDMDLFIDFTLRYDLPSEIYMSRTLVELKIINFDLGFFSGDISLPMLKILALDSLSLSSGQLQRLLFACPALEKLDIVNVHLPYRIDETVSSASLKTLTIKCTNFLHRFSFNTPNLVCLNYSESVADDYPLVNFENLVEAYINLMLLDYQTKKLSSKNDDLLENDVLLRLGNVRKLFRGICNVQKLYLSPGALQVLALCCHAMPVFNNLTLLDISSRMEIAWQAMPVLLRNCPHLDTLVIKCLLHSVTEKCGDACNCISREEKGRSLASCPVKRLEIREFDGITRDLEMVKHFLDYLPCLKEMEIYIAERLRVSASLVSEFNPEMLMRYNDLSGRSPNVKFKVHGSLPWTAQ